MRRRLLLLSAIVLLAIVAIGVDPGALLEPMSSSAAPGGRRPAGQQPAANGQRPAASDQQPEADELPPAGRGHQLPPGHPPLSRAPGQRAAEPPGLAQQRDLRRRIATAAGLGRRARDGDASAQEAVAAQLANEADPRVRAALATGEQPSGLGQHRGWAPPVLPEAAAPAEPGEVRAYWLTPQSHGGTYESSVTVDGSGRAQVDTVYEAENGERWHVRYPAWAFRDAQGRLVVDARGQPVEYVQKPEWGWWSPDSMVIGKDGLIDMIDDKHDPGQGTSGANGPG